MLKINFFANNFFRDQTTKSKGEFCDDLGIEIMIDDSAGFANECAAPNRKVFLINQPWNKAAKVKPGIIRVNSWEEIMKQINSVCIFGGGTAGWITALTINKTFPEFQLTIVLPTQYSNIGVGESTQDNLITLIAESGMDFKDFLEKTDIDLNPLKNELLELFPVELLSFVKLFKFLLLLLFLISL